MKKEIIFKQIPSKHLLIRYYSMQIVQTLPIKQIHEKKLLEQQISELLQNAIIHGNKNREELNVSIRYAFKESVFTILIKDEGNGFNELEHWNKWKKKRTELEAAGKTEEFELFAVYQKRGSYASEYSGGTGLFSAAEYWNKGFIFSSEGNTITASKSFYPDFIEDEYADD